MGIDDGLGIAGRAGGEQEFCNGVRRDTGECSRDAGVVSRAQELAEHRGFAITQWIARDHQLDFVRQSCVNRARERPAVIGKYQSGREPFDHRPQFSEVARHQRIGRRYRRIRNADIHRRQSEQRMLDVVAGQHDQWPFGRQTATQHRRANSFHVGKDLRVSELAPFALRVALREEDAIRRDLRPMLERLAQLVVIAFKCSRCPDMDDPAGALLDDRIERAQPYGSAAAPGLCMSRATLAIGSRTVVINCASPSARAFRENPSGALLRRGRPAQSLTSALRPRSRLPDPFPRCAAAPA